MPSSYTPSLRFELQFTGENVNLWGDKLNAALSRADDAVAGWLTKPLTGDYTLATANGGADEARKAMLKFTGTGSFTVTVPAVSKRYDVWNACTGVLTISNGSVSTTVQVGEIVSIVTDGGANIGRVQGNDYDLPTSNRQVASKLYVDNVAFTANAGILPGQGGNSGKFLTTNGTVAAWSNVTSATDYLADQTTRAAAATALAIAFATAL
jgi:hypothetical protein